MKLTTPQTKEKKQSVYVLVFFLVVGIIALVVSGHSSAFFTSGLMGKYLVTRPFWTVVGVVVISIVGQITFNIVKGWKHSKHTMSTTYDGLRTKALTSREEGVVMDIGLSGGSSATIVALSSGDASIYLSSGGGYIGGFGHTTISKAAKRAVTLAQKMPPGAMSLHGYPVPEEGKVHFYLLTKKGVTFYTLPEKKLLEGKDAFSELFFAMDAIMTEFRKLDQSKEFQKKNLQELIAVPESVRDGAWQEAFYQAALDTLFIRGNDFIGPDGFPYVQFKIPAKEDAAKNLFRIQDIEDDLFERGRGLVLFDEYEQMLWVFSYGKVWSLKQFGTFMPPVPDTEEIANTDVVVNHPSVLANKEHSMDEITFSEDREVLIGQPDPIIFPLWARQNIATYLESCGFKNPKMFMLVDLTMQPSHNFVFSVFPEDFTDEKQYQTLMEKLNWFLPASLSIISMPKHLAENYQSSFEPLHQLSE
jgi:hypothetical protein